MSEPVVVGDGVRRDDEVGRYELVIDGAVVAFAEFYAAADGVDVFPHTVTDPRVRGRGYAGRVVQAAMDDERARGRRVVAACSYVATFFDAHTEYADLRVG